VVDPPSATIGELLTVHSEAYVRAVQRYSAHPELAGRWECAQCWPGSRRVDTPARARGLHEAAAGRLRLVAGRGPGSSGTAPSCRPSCPCCGHPQQRVVQPVRRLLRPTTTARYAIRALLASVGRAGRVRRRRRAPRRRGTSGSLRGTRRVLNLLGARERALPVPGQPAAWGSGGTGPGLGTSVNVPLPPFTGDEPTCARSGRYRPSHPELPPRRAGHHSTGADPHHADPLAHPPGEHGGASGRLPRAARHRLRRVRRALAGALRLAGTTSTCSRAAGTLQLATMLEVTLDDALPPAWLDAARERVGQRAHRPPPGRRGAGDRRRPAPPVPTPRPTG